MDKNSKWYKDIQILYKVAEKYGDVQVKNDDDKLDEIYREVKEIAEKQDKFAADLLLAFVIEKKREWQNLT